VQTVHVVEESVEWSSSLHEPVNLGVEAKCVSIIDKAALCFDFKGLLFILSGSGLKGPGFVILEFTLHIKGQTNLWKVLEFQLLESFILNSDLAFSNNHSRVSGLILEESWGLVKFTKQLSRENILIIQEKLDTCIRHVLIAIDLQVKLTSRSKIKVNLD